MVLSVGERDKENEKGVSEKKREKHKKQICGRNKFSYLKRFPQSQFLFFFITF